MPTRTASILQKLLQGVLWAAFGAFLFASLPHVAYFFAAFEPESNNGSLNDYWWFVSYGLAASIDVTAFLLSLNVAIKMRHVTFGLPWYQKALAALGVIMTHWPFILLLVGFSWLVNFEHAKEFHSSMLAAAEQVSINLIVWQGKLADLNPVIASSFPLLAVAYTGMADQMGDEQQTPTQDLPAQTNRVTTHPAEENRSDADPSLPDVTTLLETWQMSQQQILQALQTITEQHQQVIEHLTQQSLAQFAETVKSVMRELREQEMGEQGVNTAHAAERRMPAETDLPLAGNQQDQPRPRDPVIILQELIEHLPHLASNEADALKVIHMYQRGMDRTTIRDALHFGTNKYSTIIKAIGDAVQAGQVRLFASALSSIHDEPSMQTEHLPGHAALANGASHLSILPSIQQEAMDGHEQQTDAIPVLSGIVGAAQAECHSEQDHDSALYIREAAGLPGR
jgi:hypothetical protein